MRKKFLVTILILATLGIAGTVQAQVSSANLWKLVSNAIFPVKSTWEFGSATSRIQKGWFNNLDANNATIGSIGVSGSVAGDMVVSGQIRNATGTQAAPSYSFNSDTNSGLYSGGADILKFANGGADSLTILANGNMGVATATPTYKMDINGSLRANSTITFNSLASTTNTLVAASTAGTLSSIANNSVNWNDAYTNRITGAVAPLALSSNSLSIPAASASVNGYLATSTFATFNNKVSSQWTTNGSNVYYTTGSVGIGTTNPGKVLEIASTGNNAGIRIRNSDVGSLATWNIGADSAYGYGLNIGESGVADGRLFIKPGGNVGIGTTNPAYKLQVQGDTWATSRVIVGSLQAVTFTGNGYLGYVSGHGGLGFSTNQLNVGDIAGEKMRISGAGGLSLGSGYVGNDAGAGNMIVSGSVGIGVTDPAVKTQIMGSYGLPSTSGSTPNGMFLLGGSNNGLFMGVSSVSPYGSWIQSQDRYSLSTNYPLLLNPNGGSVGIGLTNPSYKLDVSGSIHGTSYYSSDGTIGTSTTINVRKADDTGACTITVKNGLITTTTCP